MHPKRIQSLQGTFCLGNDTAGGEDKRLLGQIPLPTQTPLFVSGNAKSTAGITGGISAICGLSASRPSSKAVS
jgi:hypothetical protein